MCFQHGHMKFLKMNTVQHFGKYLRRKWSQALIIGPRVLQLAINTTRDLLPLITPVGPQLANADYAVNYPR